MHYSEPSTQSELAASLKANRPALVATAGFSMLVNLLGIAVPVYMLQLYNHVLSSNSQDTLIMLTLVTAGVLLVLGLLDHLRGQILTRVSLSMDSHLGSRTLSALMTAATRNNRINDAQALRDLDTIRRFIGGNGLLTLFDTPWVPFYIALIFLLHPSLGMIALVGAIALFGLALTGEWLTRKAESVASHEQRLGQRFADISVRNAGTAISMGMAPTLLALWREKIDKSLLIQMDINQRTAWIGSTTRALRQGLQVAALGTGAWLVLEQAVTPGVMIAASILLSRGLAPVESSIAQWKGFSGCRDAWQRLDQLLREEPAATERMELPAPKGQLALEGVVYAPMNQAAIIKGVSFSIRAGESLALIGPSGSGKSTLARLITGALASNHGRVLLDGSDLNTCNKDEFGKHIGYLPQDVELFDGSIKDNIARLNRQALAPDIIRAAQLASVHELILSLPEGYDTRIGAGGITLSAGQRQRIGLARALFGMPGMVVLDEPNANLDADGEIALKRTLAELKHLNITTIIIAHRKGILGGVDKILALNEGRVAAFGLPRQVMEQINPTSPRPVHSQLKTA